MMAGPTVSDEEYPRLAQVRTGLRRFPHWSELRANAADLTGSQHQLFLLAVKGPR